MDNDFDTSIPDFDAPDPSAKFVTVSNGTRRLDVPDGEGYLKTVESGDSQGLPDGTYDLSKARVPSTQGDRSYSGQVVHVDKEHVYQFVGTELLKHSAFELAKEELPAIGAKIAVSYATGMPMMTDGGYTSATAVHASKVAGHVQASAPREELAREANLALGGGTTAQAAQPAPAMPSPSVAQAGSVQSEAAADIEKMFRHDPRPSAGRDVEGVSAAHLSDMRTKIDGNPEYAQEIHRLHPDLFGKAASPQAQESMRTVIEAAERVDQARTASDTVLGKGDEKKPNEQGAEKRKAEDERERQGFTMPAPILQSAEARAMAAREMMSRAHSLAPAYAAKQLLKHTTGEAAPQHAAQHTPKPKLGRSR